MTYLLREALPSDLRDIGRIAAHLDTVNLPNNEAVLRNVIARSRRAFSGEDAPRKREYLFVLEDSQHERVIGTSMIIAQHGTRESPHLYFDVLNEERYSETLKRHFKRVVLRLGANYDGPTEIGGLVLLPRYRGDPAQLGKQLSYVRFLYMAMNPDWFRPVVLSELLPPLEPSGKSLLWEHLGRNFTGLSYQEADRISHENKEFIRTLFPHSAIHACLFPRAVQAMIGKVGAPSRGVEKMLRRIGFRYTRRIDPFDGGRHYEAHLRKIRVVRDARRGILRTDAAHRGVESFGLLGVHRDRGRVRFAAVQTEFVRTGKMVAVPPLAAAALRLRAGDEVWTLPFPAPGERDSKRTVARQASDRGVAS